MKVRSEEKQINLKFLHCFLPDLRGLFAIFWRILYVVLKVILLKGCLSAALLHGLFQIKSFISFTSNF